jgi:hypothetical protein
MDKLVFLLNGSFENDDDGYFKEYTLVEVNDFYKFKRSFFVSSNSWLKPYDELNKNKYFIELLENGTKFLIKDSNYGYYDKEGVHFYDETTQITN